MIRTLARPLLASAFAVDGAQMLLNSNEYADDAKAVNGTLRTVVPAGYRNLIPEDVESTVRIVGTTKVLASAMLATGKAPRLAAATLAALQVPTTLSRHSFWNASNSAEKKEEIRGLITDLALLGGLAITSADTAGKPGLKWRVQKAMPGKSEQQKMLENAQGQAQNLFEKTKDVASQVQENVSDYVDEHSDDWKDTAENLKDQALEFAGQAQDFAGEQSKKLRKQAKKKAKKLG
ncbi:MAG TPA: DoxX family protein [Candidatus Corynebacterium gallistercoris]|uniref:DoxX family protein n=1 Tax=Candidatus Corynebacterium gallistercoris TaxID=2838530 RepID=A0A9D1RWG3_9CORY|nr:DoxX family protein [Candidatus Corynebacterium gallistercoris]